LQENNVYGVYDMNLLMISPNELCLKITIHYHCDLENATFGVLP